MCGDATRCSSFVVRAVLTVLGGTEIRFTFYVDNKIALTKSRKESLYVRWRLLQIFFNIQSLVERIIACARSTHQAFEWYVYIKAVHNVGHG